MEDIPKLKKLIEFGIPLWLLARECHCTSASIQNYVSGRSLPNGTKSITIKEGLAHILETMEAILKE